ncbi:PREDICTED: alpha-tocopherol transfer protein-like [Papilio polytes]|uniref:alpha-tocopherol transfer protein-like n=1 Tax=Papilio polytes TaxID=76194 RepID=UPI0006769431|nr:PREDICTED: alpha-tocopherol transfer protein-like [Papilio polytes]XP_013140559.1 PREDICTED: alpha-tocopherol transfer protein-like [Papilio polytes]
MPQDLQQEVISMREWLAKEPHLPKDIDDFMLEKFLHSCYGSLERTKKCIERFCSTRSLMSEIYSLRDPISPNIKTAFSITNVSTHEAGEDEILIHQFEDPSLEKFQFYDILKSFSLQADMWLMEQKFLPEGHIIILDMKNYSLRMVSKINIFFVREFFMYLLEGLPVRVKQIYAINAPSFYDKLFALVKPVLPSEICNIIRFLPDSQSLYKHIDRKYLPSEYGGEAESIKAQHKGWVEQIQEQRSRFLNDNLWKADLKKKSKNNSFENAMNGSFKTLCID